MAKKKHARCGRKRRYRSPEHARHMQRNASQHRGTQLRVYLCPSCDGWHLTKRLEWKDMP